MKRMKRYFVGIMICVMMLCQIPTDVMAAGYDNYWKLTKFEVTPTQIISENTFEITGTMEYKQRDVYDKPVSATIQLSENQAKILEVTNLKLLNSDNTEFGTMEYYPSFKDEWGETVPGCLALDFEDIDVSTPNRDDGEGDLKTWNVKFSATVKAKTVDKSKDGEISIYPISGIRSDNCNSTLNVTVKNQEESGNYGVHEIREYGSNKRKVEEKNTGKIVADFSVCMNHDKSTPGTKDGPTWGYKKISNVGEEEYKTYRTAKGNGNFIAVKRLMYYYLNNSDNIAYSVFQNEYWYQETQLKLYNTNYSNELYNTQKQNLRAAVGDSSKDDDIEKRLVLTIFYSATNKRMQNVITGRLLPAQESEKINLKVNKVWQDENGNELISTPKNAEIKVKLYADDVELSKTLILNKSNSWTGNFIDLDEYKDGSKINYTVKEDGVGADSVVAINGTNYISKVEPTTDGYKITNKEIKEIYEPEKMNLKVNKVWQDENGNELISPPKNAKIKVKLYADGVELSKTLTLNKSNSWKGEFKDLAKTSRLDGSKINYTVKEDGVGADSVVAINGTNYISKVEPITDGYKITNKEIKEIYEPEKPSTPSKPEKPNKMTDRVPKTGDESNLFIYTLILILSLSSMGYIKFKCRKRKIKL